MSSASSSTPGFSRGYLAFALAVNYAAMTSLAIAIYFLPVFLTTLQDDSSLSTGASSLTNEQLGRIGGFTFAGLVVGILVTGPLADRFGAKLSAVAGNALVAVGLLAMSLSPGFDALLGAVFCMGLGAGILDMVLSPIVAALQPDNRTGAMNWLHSFFAVGAVLAVLAATLSLQFGISWRMMALILIPIPVAVGVAFAMLRLPPLVPDDGERTPMGTLMRQPVFLVAMVAIFLAGATELGLAQWMPAYSERSLGYSKETAGYALVGFNVAMALGRMSIAAASARFTPMTLMLAGCAATVALFVVACFAPWPVVAMAGCIAVGFTGSALWPSMLATSADLFPRGGATMFGVLAALGNAGGIFMPWGVGVVADHSSMHLGIFTAAACPLLMIVCLLWMQTRMGGEGTARRAGKATMPMGRVVNPATMQAPPQS